MNRCLREANFLILSNLVERKQIKKNGIKKINKVKFFRSFILFIKESAKMLKEKK